MGQGQGSADKREVAGTTATGIGFTLLVVDVGISSWAQNYPVVWRYSMWMNAPNSLVAFSVVIVVCLTILLARWETRKSQQVSGCVTYLIVGFPLLFALTQLGLIINGVLDNSASQNFTVQVVSKRRTSSSKSGTRWYLVVNDWSLENQTVQIPVSRSRHDNTSKGDIVKVTTKTGVLGWEWMPRLP